MATNKINTDSPDSKVNFSKIKGLRTEVVSFITSLFSGKFLAKDKFFESFPFLFFVFGLLILYISNGYYVEKTVKQLQKTSREIKDLRSEYITIKSELNFMSQQSQIAIGAKSIGLEESRNPPVKIYLTPKEQQRINYSDD